MRRIGLGLVALTLTLTGCGGGGGVTPPTEPDRASNVTALAAALSGELGFDQVRFAGGSTAAAASSGRALRDQRVLWNAARSEAVRACQWASA